MGMVAIVGRLMHTHTLSIHLDAPMCQSGVLSAGNLLGKLGNLANL